MAYRSFARKHEMTRANLRRKTALLRVLESRLDKREDALHDLHERSQETVRPYRRYRAAESNMFGNNSEKLGANCFQTPNVHV